jgi:hypothetical protein
MVSQVLYSTARADVLQMDVCMYVHTYIHTALFMGENRISPLIVELIT